MKIVTAKIGKKDLIDNYCNYFKTFIKAVVDIEKEVIALDAELHSDLEAYLLENSSKQENIWGINLYPFKDRQNFVEYTSLINIRPYQDNCSMEITNIAVKKKIDCILHELISYGT